MISFLPKLKPSSEFPKNLFCYQEWSGTDGTPVAPIESGTVEDISGYVDLDSSYAADLIVVDECDGTFVVAKMSRQKSSQMGGKKFWKETRTSMTEVIKSKPDIHRGDKNGGHNSRYTCFGHRKEQKKSGELGEYTFKSNTSAGEAEQINCKIDKLVGKMELVGSNLTSQMPEHKHFVECKKKLDLPSVATGQDALATQFSVGQDYWSKGHIDKDAFFTLLSALSANNENHDEVLYYFCYPEYKLKIPIKSGDLIVFNPLKFHSCSNCKFKNSFIFSAYVSEKTFMTAAIGKGLHN